MTTKGSTDGSNSNRGSVDCSRAEQQQQPADSSSGRQSQGNQRDMAAAVCQQQHGSVDGKIASGLEWQWQL